MSSSDFEYANTEDDDDILYHVPHGNEDVKNNLLFIHMTVVQKLLLQCYDNLVLMDATYCTCRLMHPLFFLTMKANVNYSPVTSFIVQNEMQSPYPKHYLGVKVQKWVTPGSPSVVVSENY